MTTADTHPPLRWGAEALWQRLQPLLPGLSVEVLARTDSTNTQLLHRARRAHDAPGVAAAGTTGTLSPGRRGGDLEPCLLVAEQQTGGRGRQGKRWESSAGASLTFSLALPLAPTDWSGLSLAVGLALADALDPHRTGVPPRIGLKWPNDLLLLDGTGGGRKLGGILIETVAVGGRRLAVIGIGLNVQPRQVADAPWGVACLQELSPGITAPQALADLAEPLVRTLLAFEAEGFAPLRAGYARRDALRGQAVTTTLPELPEGIADGVDEGGALWLRVGDDRRRVSSGEVSVRRASGANPPPTPETPAC